MDTHLRSLRARVPDLRLYAPRIAMLLTRGDRVVVGRDGVVPFGDIDLGESASFVVQRLLGELELPPARLRLRAVHSGAHWFEEHPELGPLQPIWIVVSGEVSARAVSTLPTRQMRDVTLGAPPSYNGFGSGSSEGAYVTAVRKRVGREPIFYPWCGAAVRKAETLLLVRDSKTRSWHCPGGGMEIGETPSGTVARELDEETGLAVRSESLIGCWTDRRVTYPNGDQAQIVSVLLRGRAIGGDERDDRTGEIDDRGWFMPNDLPPLRFPWDERVALALTDGTAWQ